MLGSTTELTKFSMLHPFHIEQRLEVHILQVEKSRVKGNHTTKHTNATYIDKGERILCTMSLNPAPSGVGSQASGYVSGK